VRAMLLAAMLLVCSGALATPQIAAKRVDMRQALDDLALAASNHGMTIVKVQPIDNALVKRGYDNPHVRLAFIGSETAVRWAEAADPRLLNLLPLRFALIQQGDQVLVMTDDLAIWMPYFSDTPGRRLLEGWEAELKDLLQDFLAQ